MIKQENVHFTSYYNLNHEILLSGRNLWHTLHSFQNLYRWPKLNRLNQRHRVLNVIPLHSYYNFLSSFWVCFGYLNQFPFAAHI